MKRHKLSRRVSKKSFKRHSGVHPTNNYMPMRGGIRL